MKFDLLKFPLCIALLISLVGCGVQTLHVSQDSKGGLSETFGYQSWKRAHNRQDVVIIGIHGFCGASVDYKNLGNYLVRRQSNTAVYAYEVRGQGRDPIPSRRGDIGNAEEWYNDLQAFTHLVKTKHPGAKIIWYGESMGSLIATHALSKSDPNHPPCDALVLSSPIVRFKDDIEPWKVALVRAAAATLPLARVPLNTFSGGQDIQMTETSVHSQQVQINDYHIEKHTLRLLGSMAKLIGEMNERAASIQLPTLVLHGNEDYFNNDADMRGFIDRMPKTTDVTYHNYEGAYHLLMYDEKRKTVFRDVARWVNLLRH